MPGSAAGRWPEPMRGPGNRIAIASYLGKGESFERAMADFAEVYADQNEADYREFEAAISKGRLKAVTGI